MSINEVYNNDCYAVMETSISDTSFVYVEHVKPKTLDLTRSSTSVQ